MSTKRLLTKYEIAQRVRQRREYMGIDREEMAALLGIGYAGYSNKETGEREISSIDLAKIARRLGVSTDYLLGEEDEADLSQHEIIRFFDGLPPQIQKAELEHMRALHAAHVEAAQPPVIGQVARRSTSPASDEDEVTG